MGGRQVGRSEPAFRVASTTALPPPTCTARREAGQRRLLAVVLLRGRPMTSAGCCFAARPVPAGSSAAVVSSRPVPVGSSAGYVRLQRPCSAGFVSLPPLPFHAHCPHRLPPFSFALPPPVHFHVLQDRRGSCKDCPVGSYNTGLQWRPVRRFLTFDSFFSCRVH